MSCYPSSRVDASQRLLKGTFQHLKVNFSPAQSILSNPIQSIPIQYHSTHTELNSVSDFPCSLDWYVSKGRGSRWVLAIDKIAAILLNTWVKLSNGVTSFQSCFKSFLSVIAPCQYFTNRRSRLDPLISYKRLYNLI